MSVIGIDMLSYMGVPDLHRLIPRTRSNVFPIGRPGDRPHRVCMPAIGEDKVSGSGVPHLHCAIEGGSGNVLSIRRPASRIDTPGVSMVGEAGGPTTDRKSVV